MPHCPPPSPDPRAHTCERQTGHDARGSSRRADRSHPRYLSGLRVRPSRVAPALSLGGFACNLISQAAQFRCNFRRLHRHCPQFFSGSVQETCVVVHNSGKHSSPLAGFLMLFISCILPLQCLRMGFNCWVRMTLRGLVASVCAPHIHAPMQSCRAAQIRSAGRCRNAPRRLLIRLLGRHVRTGPPMAETSRCAAARSRT
jgi:hypothetical protein